MTPSTETDPNNAVFGDQRLMGTPDLSQVTATSTNK
jgi:hypothetical protein